MAFFTNMTTIACLALINGLLLFLFVTFRHAVGGKYLDELISHSKSQKLVDQLTSSQVSAHIYATCLLDTVFPACYGLLFVTLMLRFAGLENGWLSIAPVVVAVIADYLENWAHAIALRTKRVPKTKSIVTSAKWACLASAIAVAALSWSRS